MIKTPLVIICQYFLKELKSWMPDHVRHDDEDCYVHCRELAMTAGQLDSLVNRHAPVCEPGNDKRTTGFTLKGTMARLRGNDI